MIIQTPMTHHLDFEHVYEPAEDSFLLLDALEKDLESLKDSVFCLEIGSGSGIISVALASVLPTSFVFACDLNPKACQATLKTAQVNNDQNRKIDVIHCDFVQGFPLDPHSGFDLIVCNPPYVATEEKETKHNDIFASWAGGVQGRNLTDNLIDKLPTLLSDQGCAYIVLEQCNHPNEVKDKVESLQLKADFVLSRRAGREFLRILKVKR